MVGRDETSDYPAEALSPAHRRRIQRVQSRGHRGPASRTWYWRAAINTPELVASLENLGLTVYFLPNPATLEEMYTNLETVATLTGHESETATLVEIHSRARVAAVDAKIMPLIPAPRRSTMSSMPPTRPSLTPPARAPLLTCSSTRAGGINIGANLQGQWPQISLEQLVVANPGHHHPG